VERDENATIEADRRTVRRILIGLASVAMIGGGIWGIDAEIEHLREYRRFPKAEAVVTSYDVGYHDTNDEVEKEYFPVVTFQVDGTSYSGELDEHQAYDDRSDVPLGSKHTVAYDPANPRHFLIRSAWNYLAFVPAALLVLLGLLKLAHLRSSSISSRS
jgi:hypothetical protein